MRLTKDTRRWLIQGAVLGWAVACGREGDPNETQPGGDGDGDGDASAVGGALMGSGGTSDINVSGPDERLRVLTCEALSPEWDLPCSEGDIVMPAECASSHPNREFVLPLDDLAIPTAELMLVYSESELIGGAWGQGGSSLTQPRHGELVVELVPEDAGVVTDEGRRFVATDHYAHLVSSIDVPTQISLEEELWNSEFAIYVALVSDEEIISQRRILFGRSHWCIAK